MVIVDSDLIGSPSFQLYMYQSCLRESATLEFSAIKDPQEAIILIMLQVSTRSYLQPPVRVFDLHVLRTLPHRKHKSKNRLPRSSTYFATRPTLSLRRAIAAHDVRHRPAKSKKNGSRSITIYGVNLRAPPRSMFPDVSFKIDTSRGFSRRSLKPLCGQSGA